MGISYVVALVLLIYGFSLLIDKNTALGLVMILISILTPLFERLFLYPIFALSLIETNLSKVDANLERVIELIDTAPSDSDPTPNTETPPPIKNPTPIKKTVSTLTPNPPPFPISPINEALQFINQKYGIQIEISDDIDTLKEKIAKIESEESSSQIFKNRVADSKSIDEIWSLIKMHHTVHKN